MAVLRYLLLPLYAQWWVKQTSPNAFGLLLFLYITQMINWAVYTYNVNRIDPSNEANVLAKTNNTNSTNAVVNDKVSETEVRLFNLFTFKIINLSCLDYCFHIGAFNTYGIKPFS